MSKSAMWMSSLVVVAWVGCTSGPGENPNWPKRYKTTGSVTYQGKPVEGADIVFMSNDGKSTATGKTDSAGKFALTTYTEKDGAVIGPQSVTVRRVDVVDMTPKDVDVSAGGKSVPPKITWIVPEKFSLPSQSGLKAEVTESGPNDFSFDLK